MEVIKGMHKILFIGEKYTTSYDKDRKEWNCDCKHGTIGENHDENPCKHVKYCIDFLRNKRRLKKLTHVK